MIRSIPKSRQTPLQLRQGLKAVLILGRLAKPRWATIVGDTMAQSKSSGGPMSAKFHLGASRSPSRRAVVQSIAACAATLAAPGVVLAQSSSTPFARWVDTFRPRALARGVSEATYAKVMGELKPDTTVFKELVN